jgi:predicted nucleic acid-binding protein
VYAFEVEIPAGTGGLRTRSKIMVNQTRAVDKARFLKKLGSIPEEIMAHVNRALKLHYELTCPPRDSRIPRSNLPTRDAFHAATMINNKIETIISVDPHFDSIPQLRRIPPEQIP